MPPKYGFIDCSQSVTGRNRKYARYADFATADEYFDEKDRLLILPPVEASKSPTFRLRQYRSGEISASYFLGGVGTKVMPEKRDGAVITSCFTSKSRQKIRRAIENTSTDFRVFLTLTFAPGQLQPWHFEEETRMPGFVGPGRMVIRHDYAKHKLKLLRMALTQRFNREIRANIKAGAYFDRKMVRHELRTEEQIEQYRESMSLRFVWAGELQQNGNIHFHILLNRYIPIEYLTRLWGQANNSVDVEFLKDAEHAANYITKYLTKDGERECQPIKGNRYNMSANLRRESEPIMTLYKEDKQAIEARKLLQLITGTIQENGGQVIGCGFGMVMPRPRKSKPYKDKTGKVKRTRGIDSKMHDAFLDTVFPCPI